MLSRKIDPERTLLGSWGLLESARRYLRWSCTAETVVDGIDVRGINPPDGGLIDGGCAETDRPIVCPSARYIKTPRSASSNFGSAASPIRTTQSYCRVYFYIVTDRDFDLLYSALTPSSRYPSRVSSFHRPPNFPRTPNLHRILAYFCIFRFVMPPRITRSQAQTSSRGAPNSSTSGSRRGAARGSATSRGRGPSANSKKRRLEEESEGQYFYLSLSFFRHSMIIQSSSSTSRSTYMMLMCSSYPP